MSETIYQVHFTGRNGKREYLYPNLYSKRKAQEAVKKLAAKKFKDVRYKGFTFSKAYDPK